MLADVTRAIRQLKNNTRAAVGGGNFFAGVPGGNSRIGMRTRARSDKRPDRNFDYGKMFNVTGNVVEPLVRYDTVKNRRLRSVIDNARSKLIGSYRIAITQWII